MARSSYRDANGSRYRNADPLSEDQKKNIEKIRGTVGDKVANKIGTFKESTGGGVPIPAGEKLKDHPELDDKRVQQPRDEDGQFTYNAVNAKELKDGPSRGDTIPPTLRGEEVPFVVKTTKERVDETGRVYVDEIQIRADDYVEVLRHYLSDEKGFKGLKTTTTSKVKRGRRSNKSKDFFKKQGAGVYKQKTQELGGKAQLDNYYTVKGLKNDVERVLRGEEPIGESRLSDDPEAVERRRKIKEAKDRIKERLREKENPEPQDGGTPGTEEPTPAAEEPTPTTEEPTPTNNGGGHPDKELAKNNPQEFAKKYSNEIQEIKSLLKEKKKTINTDKLIDLIGKGEEDFDKIKSYISKL